MKNIIEIPTARVLCDATVDLISKVRRPYLFRVTVQGKPPHIQTRIYEIEANSDNVAAMTGIDRFVKEMASPLAIEVN